MTAPPAAKVKVALTNTATSTAVRGPGLVQAIAVTETIVQHLAATAGVDAQELRTKNICKDSAATANMHGTPAEGIKGYNMPAIWERLATSSEVEARKAAVTAFNAANKWKKRGISMIPMKYSHCWLFSAGINCTVSIQAVDTALGGAADRGPGCHPAPPHSVFVWGIPMDGNQ
jgi:xanthine dehydrogenase molybdopterin-binding subunit B